MWSKLVHSNQGWSQELINQNGGRRHMTSYRLRDIGDYEEYSTFAIARNPWERTVSHYFMCLKYPSRVKLENHVAASIGGFNRFARLHKVNGKLASCLQYVNPNRDHKWFTMDKMDEVFDFLDIEPYHTNKGNHLHYSHYYTPETKWAISEYYKDDIEKFGFKFEEK